MSLQYKYDEYQQTIRSLQEHVVSVESQLYEHEIVVETLRGVPEDRKAWRLVSNGDSVLKSNADEGDDKTSGSGALVETTAKDARLKLEETISGLKSLKAKLESEIVDVKKEFEDWKTKNNVKIVQSV